MTDTVLLLSLGERIGAPRAAGIAGRLADGLPNVRVSAYAAVDEDETYLYIDGGEGTCPKWARAWPSSCPAPACACCTGRWTCRAPPAARTRPGTTSSRPMLPEAEADLNAWYDQEHLPGRAGHRARAAL